MRLIPALRVMAEDQRRSLLLWAPIALGCGIAAYFEAGREPSMLLAVTIAAASMGLMALALIGRSVAPATLIALAAMGFADAKLQSERVAAPVLSEVFFGPVAGRVVGLDRSSKNSVRLMLDQVYLAGMAAADTPRRVRVVLAKPPDPAILTPGARVMMRARLTPPPPPVEPRGFDFRRHAWFLKLGGIGFTAEPVVLERPLTEAGGGVWLFRLRMRLSDAIRAEIPGRNGGFAAAILTGDRSGVDPGDLVDLRASNLAHLLAISGLHMGLLTGAVFFALRMSLVLLPGVALRWRVKKIAACGALLAGLAYLAVSGGSVATQRAFVMAAVIFAAVLADRPAMTLRAVALAAMIVLLWRPDSLYGAGFQMSFAATVALIAGYNGLKRKKWWRGMQGGGRSLLRGALALVFTSAVAGLATAPFSAFHFNQLAQYGLLANILAVPAMGFLVMPAALAAFLLWPVGLQGAGFAAMGLGIGHILNVAHRVAELEGALTRVPTGPGWALAALALGALGAVILRGPVRTAGLALGVAGLCGWALSERPVILVDPGGRLVGVRGTEGRALNRSRGEGFAAQVWLENDGDPADQRTAAARAPSGGEAFDIRLEDGTMVYWRPGDDIDADLCRAGALLIAPAVEAPPSGGCYFLGAAELAQGGAHAFHTGRIATPETAAGRTGSRPWTAPQ